MDAGTGATRRAGAGAACLACAVLLILAGSSVGEARAKDFAQYPADRFFDPEHLVRVELRIDPQDWEKLRWQHRSLIQTLRTDLPDSERHQPFDYFKAEIKIDGVELGAVAVRKKGFVGSLSEKRPSLKIQLDRFDDDKLYAGLDTLTLNNNLQDSSSLAQVIGYKLFRDAGLPASRCNLAVVTVNGESLGVYSNVESLDRQFFRRRDAGDKGTLYEGTVCDFHPRSLARFERKFGSKAADAKLQAVARALAATDAQLWEALGRHVDLEQFVRFWAMEVLLGHWDGYVSNRNNYFVYYSGRQDRIQFLPWGMDQLGQDQNPFWRRGFKPPLSVKADAEVPRRLYAVESARERYFRTLESLLQEVWNEKEIIDMLDRLAVLVRPHLLTASEPVDAGLAEGKKFIRERRGAILAELRAGYPEWKLEPRDHLGGIAKIGDCTIQFSCQIPEVAEEQRDWVEAAGEAVVALTIDGERVAFDAARLRLRRGSSWGRARWALRIVPTGGGEPLTLELVFPEPDASPGANRRPVRVDVFASPAEGRVFRDSNPAPDAQPMGVFGGTLELGGAASGSGGPIRAELRAEVFAFKRD